MLPKVPEPPMPGKHTIFVNPNFNRGGVGVTQFVDAATMTANNQLYNVKAHVNPLFLKQKLIPQMPLPLSLRLSRPPPPPPTTTTTTTTSTQTPYSIQQPSITPTIHMNPKVFYLNPLFMQKTLLEQQQKQHMKQFELQQQQQHLHQQQHQIVKPNVPTNSKGNVSVQATKENCKLVTSNAAARMQPAPPTAGAAPLLHLSKRKLVRKPVESSSETISIIKPISIKANTKLDISNPKKRYKIDRTKNSEAAPAVVPIPKPKIINKAIVKKKYVLKNKPETIAKLVNKSDKRITPMKLINNNMHKLVRINNILYKTTHNKLLRKDLENTASVNTNTSKLTTAASSIANMSTPLSYYLKTTSNLKTRNHISSAKNKSMTQLRKRFVKSNEPCLIFQRLGKCAAFEKGRCNKQHNKEQVVICPKYLRGECFNAQCLLSHNVCLEKMPVCKFYLQANCFRENCPYLHKKLSKKAEVCMDFVRGYCERAGKCNKRHEFVCPALAANKKCVQTNCLFCKPKSQFKLPSSATVTARATATVTAKATAKSKAALSKITKEPLSNQGKACKTKPAIDSPTKAHGKEKEIPEIAKRTEEEQEQEQEHDDDQNQLTTRYFEAAPQALAGLKDPEAMAKAEKVVVVKADEAEASVVVGRKRPQLGQLPAFIPLS